MEALAASELRIIMSDSSHSEWEWMLSEFDAAMKVKVAASRASYPIPGL